MRNALVGLRNVLAYSVYQVILKPIFFRFDPENIHDRMLNMGKRLSRYAFTRALTRMGFGYSHPMLAQTVLGIEFKNPIGLAAGFDKNAELTEIIPSVGFGFEEVGSITGEACVGNEKPRLWRLKKSHSLLVNYGLKNDGCEAIAARLSSKHFTFPVGTSIAKTNSPETCELDVGIADYVKAFTQFTTIGAYYTINISCPNAFGGQPFTDPARLDALLSSLDRIPTRKPIFVKFSPDITRENINQIIQVIEKHRVHGFICTNLTKKRENLKIKDENVPPFGGMSGKIVEDLANDMIKYLYSKVKNKYVIIGCGGVFSAEDAYRKIRLGASLVQLITGMIYQGPQVISEINRGLVRLLKRDGFANIAQAIGRDVE